MAREVSTLVLARSSKLCNVIEYKADVKIVYKRYASLYFVVGVDPEDNELLALEIVHQFVEVLDRYFGNVCELDLIFNFHKAYYILDELILGGEIQDSSRRSVLKSIAVQDQLTEQALEGKAET
jgi:AP-1 complex subunit sigma 1/2